MPNSLLTECILALCLSGGSGGLDSAVEGAGHGILGVPLSCLAVRVTIVHAVRVASLCVHAVRVASLGQGAGVELVVGVKWVSHGGGAESALETGQVPMKMVC